jgi:hypothetical protein
MKLEDVIKANTAAMSEMTSMLVTLFEQGQKQIVLLQRLLDKEPVSVVTEKVNFPSVIQTEVLNPITTLDIQKPEWFELPNIKGFFDTLSSENIKGQFGIIDTLELILDAVKKIDLSKLQTRQTDSYGGVITPRWYNETPSGSINGSNRIFTLTTTPKTNSLFLFLGGMLLTEGEDYTIARNTITYNNAPPEGVTPHKARFQV